MKQQRLKWITLMFTLGAVLFLGACHKKTPPPPPPPPPPPAAPTASLSANPNTVEKGQSTTLTWETTNATDVSIDGIGAVQASGSQQVTPADSTTYTLTAKGAGGTQTATARVTVTMPPPPPAPVAWAYRRRTVRTECARTSTSTMTRRTFAPTSRAAMQGDIDFLKQHPDIHFTVEGHCDERGSTEYNLGFGRQSRQLREERLDTRRRQRRQHQDDQLRQGKTVLYRAHRSVLAAEPAWSFRLSEVTLPTVRGGKLPRIQLIWPRGDDCGTL